jgi:hypothetical protein
MEDPPVEIKKILKIFGIKNIHQIESKTIHWFSNFFGKYLYNIIEVF